MIRSTVGDVVRGLDWPAGFSMRMRRNAFTDRWHGNEKELAANADIEGPRYRAAFADGDPDNAGVVFGEAAGLIHAIEPAAAIVERIVDEAAQLLRSGPPTVDGPRL